MAQRMHRGGVLGFVLVGVLLMALVAGGIYVVRHQLIADTNDTESTKVAENTDKEPSKTDTKDAQSTDKPTDNPDSQSDLQEALRSQSAAEKKAQEQKEAQQRATASSESAQSTSHLPETGPSDTLVALMGAAFLAGTTFAYVRSRSLI